MLRYQPLFLKWYVFPTYKGCHQILWQIYDKGWQKIKPREFLDRRVDYFSKIIKALKYFIIKLLKSLIFDSTC